MSHFISSIRLVIMPEDSSLVSTILSNWFLKVLMPLNTVSVINLSNSLSEALLKLLFSKSLLDRPSLLLDSNQLYQVPHILEDGVFSLTSSMKKILREVSTKILERFLDSSEKKM